ncbi:MAG: hypothetical protein H0T48_00990 [Gemmatimonadaceae bacterium]|nr:hypothetical protein [Gemmatimonadaceae bacterium]
MRGRIGAIIVYGALLGALILGGGGRVAMRAITIMNGVQGSVTPSGTLTVVLAGAASGIGGAVIYLIAAVIVRHVAPKREWIRHFVFGGSLMLVTLRGLNPVDLVRLALFTPLVASFAMALELVVRRRYPRVDRQAELTTAH